MTAKKTPALSADVFAALKERIIRWEYSPAHRFTEEELCAEFGVSRSPVREALHMLVENGLVAKVPHRGYTVRQPDLKEIHDLYDVRQALELYAVEWLATHGMPEAEWSALYHTWKNLLQAQSNPHLTQENVHFADVDGAFHEKLAACTGNQALAQNLHSINERLHFARLSDITTLPRLCETSRQHLEILECIRDGNVAFARQSMKQNIEGGDQIVEQALKEALARSYQALQRAE